ncbi:MAG: adenosine kinase [Actinomycetota bacterium]
MRKKRFEVVGIGNAIVDMLANVEDDFLDMHLLKKGSMKLVDKSISGKICSCIEILEKNSGGSVANTVAGLACLGNRVAFIGKISEDEHGKAFEDSLKEAGVHFGARKSNDDQPTGHCVVLITPDAQRTMNTCLGVAGALSSDDIDEEILRDTEITFVEGYLWESPQAKEATNKAIDITKKAGGLCALSLSDSFCVKRHQDEFLGAVKEKIGMLFANEEEIKALFGTDSFDRAVQRCRELDIICAVTRSEKGSVVIKAEKVANIDIHLPGKLVDTTGAGDLYAAGFMHGYLKGQSLEYCGKAGSIIASEAISHFGARPKARLADLLKRKGC